MITKIEIYSTKKSPVVLADYNKLIKLMPEDPAIYYSRGRYYRSKKKWKLALTDYIKAIKLVSVLLLFDTNCYEKTLLNGQTPLLLMLISKKV